MRVFYFGCWGEPGHYLFRPRGLAATREEGRSLPWPHMDTTLAPGPRHPRYGEVESKDQHQGHAALHRRCGWTALAFWDRSLDRRHNSNSVFVAEGTHSANDMLSLAREHFPEIMQRFTFAIRVVETHEEAA